MSTYSFEDLLNLVGFGMIQLQVFFVAGLAYAADGAGTVIMPVLSTWIQCEFKATAIETAIMNSMLFVGKVIGTTLQGLLQDKFGRRTIATFYLWNGGFYTILFAMAPSLNWVIILRFMNGFFLGVFTTSYAIEFFPSRWRRLVVIIREIWAFGVIYAMLVANVMGGYRQWRTIIAMISLLSFVAANILGCAPESPRYLLIKGQKDDIRLVLRRIIGNSQQYCSIDEVTFTLKREARQQSPFAVIFGQKYRFITFILATYRFSFGFLYYCITLLTVTYFKESQFSQSENTAMGCSTCVPLSGFYYNTQIIFAISDLFGAGIAYTFIGRYGQKNTLFLTCMVTSLSVFSLLIIKNWIFSVTFLFIAKANISAAGAVIIQNALETYPTIFRSTAYAILLDCKFLGSIIAPFVAEVLVKVRLSIPVCITSIVTGIIAAFTLCLPQQAKKATLKDF